MTSKILPFFSILHFLFITISVLLQALFGSTNPDELYYQSCGNTFNCGYITGIGYPFRGSNDPLYCGYPNLVLSCDDQTNITTINITNTTYRVLDVYPATETMRIVRQDVTTETCPQQMVNTTLDLSLFDYTATSTNYTFLYKCPDSNPPGFSLLCGYNSAYESVYVVRGSQGPGSCKASVVVPVHETGNGGGLLFGNDTAAFGEAMKQGFEIRWTIASEACSVCAESNGRCGYDMIMNQTTCFCPDPPYVSRTCIPIDTATSPPSPTPPSPGNQRNRQGIKIALPIAGAVLAGIGLGFLIFYCRQRRKQLLPSKSSQALTKEIKNPSSKSLSSLPSTQFTQSIPSYPSSNSDLRKGSTYFGVHVFDYAELETATEFFDPTRELGDGGFGIVYYGVLSDGRKVAVKRLYENNFKRMEQFMNELEILTRLSHENLVKLYGCTSRRSRELLLVYEFIPNGTVGDHLHGKRAKSGLLSWPVRLNIAIETADALAYLHKSDIIHRDVKTNNILLDNDFHVKVADFGLSRLFPNDVTHVSTAPQGTPGYVDPEYYQCYQLTEKSDVYSFGVVLVELISSLQAVDTNRHRQDINLANMAVNKIQNHSLHELVDTSLGFEMDSTVRRKATLVAELAFRCLQQERDLRPSMVEVLETLKRIKNDDLNVDHKVEILVDDDVAPLRGSVTTSSPDSTDKWTDGSTPSSSS